MKVVLADAVVLEEYGYAVEQRIFGEQGIDFRMENCRSADAVRARCSDADVLLPVYTAVAGPLMDALPHCNELTAVRILRGEIPPDTVNGDRLSRGRSRGR